MSSSSKILRHTLLLCFFLSACTPSEIEITPIASIDEIVDGGFYGYILPETVRVENTWQVEFSMYSLDAHCKPANDSSYNPVRINYRNDSGSPILNIRISTSDAVMGGTALQDKVELNSEWFNDTAQYVVEENGEVTIRVRDNWGMDVVISSRLLSLDELVTWVSQFEYIGPDPDTVNNPWAKMCNRSW